MNSGCLLIFLASQMLGYYLYQIKYMYEYHTVSIPILQGMYQQNLCVLRSQASSERTLLSQKIGLKVSCQIIYIDETSRVYDTRTWDRRERMYKHLTHPFRHVMIASHWGVDLTVPRCLN